MALSNRERQKAYLARLKAGVPIVKVVRPAAPPRTRKAVLLQILMMGTTMRDEYRDWMEGLPEDYAERSDQNADRLALVQEFIAVMNQIIGGLSELEPPRIRMG
jgi:hypothetical protein